MLNTGTWHGAVPMSSIHQCGTRAPDGRPAHVFRARLCGNQPRTGHGSCALKADADVHRTGGYRPIDRLVSGRLVSFHSKPVRDVRSVRPCALAPCCICIYSTRTRTTYRSCVFSGGCFRPRRCGSWKGTGTGPKFAGFFRPGLRVLLAMLFLWCRMNRGNSSVPGSLFLDGGCGQREMLQLFIL
jgi:hypothetical protein